MPTRWNVVAALADRSRRALYDYVRTQDHPVSREQAAEGVHMSRALAAFHLDKLVEAGLLRARYQAPPDQPRGRGRAPKVYEVAGDELAVTIPERHYELIAGILADAVADDPTNAHDAARRHARRRGRALGAQFAEDGARVVTALDGLGFEPLARTDRHVVLRNCPFHVLATTHTDLVCGLNRALVAGVVEGIGEDDLDAVLAPRPGHCCVELVPHVGARTE